MSESISRRSFVKLSGVAIAAAGLGLFGCSQDKNPGAGSQSKSLIMYTPNSKTLVENVIPGFEKKTGIKVQVVAAGTGETFKKIESEANNPIADVVWGGSYTVYMSHTKNFEKYVAKENDKVRDIYRNTSGFYTPYALDGSVILVNKNIIKDAAKITGYKDLLDPSYQGKIVSADPTSSSSAFAHLTNMLKDFGGYDSDAAWDYVTKLFGTQIKGKITAKSSLVYKTVADGENGIGLTYEDPSTRLLNDGAPVEVVYPKEGSVFLPASSAIIKGCAHMDAAKQWIDYIVSQEGQDLIGLKTTVRPVRDDAKLRKNLKPVSDINIMAEDYEYVFKHKDEIIKRYVKIATAK